MMRKKDKVAILIPCYNEALTIKKVIRDCQKVLPSAKVYVYDNNSTDETSEIAKKAGAIVKKELRQGKGNVTRTMLEEIKADCYIFIDGDDACPVDKAKEMVEIISRGDADMVILDRLSENYFEINNRRFHSFGNKLVRFLVRVLFKGDVNDVLSGYRAVSGQAMKNFSAISCGFEIETEMTIFMLKNNYRIKEIPTVYKNRIGGGSRMSTIRDGLKILRMIFVLFRKK